MVEYDDDNSYAAELRKKPICRFCLSQEDTLTNIYSTSNTNSQVALSMQIMACVSIEVIYQVCACVFWFSSVLHCMAKLGQLLQHFFASLPLLRAIEVEKTIIAKAFDSLAFSLWSIDSEMQKILAELFHAKPTTSGACIGRVEIFNLSRTSSHSLYAPLCRLCTYVCAYKSNMAAYSRRIHNVICLYSECWCCCYELYTFSHSFDHLKRFSKQTHEVWAAAAAAAHTVCVYETMVHSIGASLQTPQTWFVRSLNCDNRAKTKQFEMKWSQQLKNCICLDKLNGNDFFFRCLPMMKCRKPFVTHAIR